MQRKKSPKAEVKDSCFPSSATVFRPRLAAPRSCWPRLAEVKPPTSSSSFRSHSSDALALSLSLVGLRARVHTFVRVCVRESSLIHVRLKSKCGID